MKWADLKSLYRRHYNPDDGTLVLPGRAGRGGRAERRVQLDHAAREALDQWLATRKQLKIGPVAPLFCATMESARGNPLWVSSIRSYLSARGAALGIENRVTIEGLRLSGRVHREGGATRRLVDELTTYLHEPAFAARHPLAHEKWRQGFELYGVNPSRFATPVGLACREACDAFADDLVAAHAAEVAVDAGTVDKLRAAIRARHGLTKRLPATLDALVRYWGSVSDLVQRQVHGAQKEGEPLTKEDARRLLFQVMFVMCEIDRALAR